MKIAISPMAVSMYATPNTPGYRMELESMLRRIRACGYDGIEMGTPQGLTHQEFRELLDAVGLTCTTAGGISGAMDDKALLSDKIEECQALGAFNVMVPNMPSQTLGNPWELHRFIGQLNRAGEALAKEGIHLSYHNHAVDFSPVDGKPMLQWIVEETDPAFVWMEPDTHWLQAGGAHVVTWLKMLKGRIYAIHCKDYGIDPDADHLNLQGIGRYFVEVGEGNLNWLDILGECRAQNIEWYVTEQDAVRGRPPYQAIELSARNLRAVDGALGA